MTALANAPSLTIEEAGGSARSITLRGRSLPYQGVSFGGTMRTNVTWYAGNPEATIQVLGPDLQPTQMEGMWKDRFLPEQFELSGFGDLDSLSTADALVRAFERFRAAGNELRVQWFNVVRRGVLTDFTPTWIRPQDVRWEATFTWFAADTETPVRAGYNPLPATDMLTATTEHDDALVLVPGNVSRDYSAEIVSRVNAVRQQAGAMFDYVRRAQNTAQMPLNLVQGCLSAADSLRAEAEDEVGRLTSIPYQYAQATDRVLAVFSCEAWRRDLAKSADSLTATALRTAEQFQRNLVPGSLAVVTVPGDMTLRQLSTLYYGSPDSWSIIADANGLVDSVVAAGVVLVIPVLPSPALGTSQSRS